ncbi:MAG: SH3 domain-containing protein [Alphaproteobacteria bacterium]|nr:SH3 domain-containing protein [Alphaproteobacteria bacterium]
MVANLDAAQDSVSQGIPLDLGPLLSPYRHHKQLSIRIEKLPQLSRLSNGRNNGDCTFSLKLDEIPGLVYLPPPDTEPIPIILVLRVINLDEDYATTLALIDVSVPSEPAADDGANPKLRVVEAVEADTASDEPPEPAALSALHVKRAPDVIGGDDNGRTDVRKLLEAELSDLRGQMESSSSEAEETHKQALQAAEAALARDFVEQLTAAREQLELNFEKRLTEALHQAEAQAEEEANARIADLEKQVEEAASRARADAQKDFEQELSQLKRQNETGTVDIDAAREQAIKTVEAEHARVIAKLRETHQSDLTAQISKTKEQLESEFVGRLEKAVSQAEKKAAGLVASAEKIAAQAQTDAERVQAKAKKAFEKEAARLQKQIDAAGSDIEKNHKRELEAAQSAHANEIAALQKSHADLLATQATAAQEQLATTRAQLEREAGELLAQADQRTQASIKEASETWQAEADAALSTARATWQTEEAERLGAARSEFEVELAQFRQKLDSASLDIDEARKAAIDAAKSKHAREIADLQSAHARALEERAVATDEQANQESSDRLTEALHQAEAKAEANLTEARQAWEIKAEASLLAARKAWKAEEADRTATAKTETSAGDEKQREQELAERLAEATRQAEEQAEKMVEARLATARQVWEADAESALSVAREIWQAEEAERLTVAKAELEAELSIQYESQNQGSDDIDIEKVRQQAIKDAGAEHAVEIEALKAAHASALEENKSTGDQSSDQDVEARIAEALREAEEKTEARLNKARLVWQTDADAKLAAARESWETEVADRRAKPKKSRKEASHDGPTARERAYRQQRDWKPRRSRVFVLLAVILIGLPLLLPEARALIIERSTQAITGLRSQIDSLRAPPPPAVEPAAVSSAATPRILPVAPTGPAEIRATIDVGSANIRVGPSSAAAVVKSLPRGSEVIVLGSENGWQNIRFGEGPNDVGWVFSDLLNASSLGEPNP